MKYISVNLLRPAHVLHLGRSFYGHNKRGKRHDKRSRVAKNLHRVSLILLVGSIVLAIATFGPQAYAYINNRLGTEWVQVLTRPSTSFGESLVASGDKEPTKVYQPIFDPTLPKQNTLIIDAIGVEALIGEDTSDNVEETLKKGPWRVPEFGTPFARKNPTILAAHRYGYLTWANDYRRKNSFYNLPKLAVGERIKIIWDQRAYYYEVYETSEGAEITNYQADLILYTCKFLDSDIRIFVYAKLLEV